MTAATYDRIAERLSSRGCDVSAPGVAALSVYYDLLYKWNARMNLTALDDGPDGIDRLIVEPVLAAAWLPDTGEHLDVGSGGGSPAIPVLVMRPSFRSTLVESRARKAAFLRELARTLGLGARARVVTARLESVDRPASLFTVVTIRAVKLDGALLADVERVAAPGAQLWYFGSSAAPEMPAGRSWSLTRTGELIPERQSRVYCFTWNKPSR